MLNTENNTAEISKCNKCGGEIKEGEPVKVSWNDYADEHIECPANAFAQAAQ